MKTICPTGNHHNHNGFVATHAPGHMMYVCIRHMIYGTSYTHAHLIIRHMI